MSSLPLPPEASAVRFDLGLEANADALDASPARMAIGRLHRADEKTTVAGLVGEAQLNATELATTQALATQLAQAVRSERARAGGVDALMVEFSLDSDEGIALMCLAEALLRIPDNATRDQLIRDKLARGQWRSHVGASPSLFVNAAAWGLVVTGRLMDSHSENRLEQALASLLRKGGEPMIRRGVDLAMRLLGRQFVTGRTIEEALANAREREARGYTFSYDMLGEGAVTAQDAQRYLGAYEAAVHAIGRASSGRGVHGGPGISVKLSALHPRFVRSQRQRVHRELMPRVLGLARLAQRYDIGLNIDAEEADRLELSLEVLAHLANDPVLRSWQGLGFVVQAYQKRARPAVDWIVELARRQRRRINLRLVKGAYWDTEIKRAQVDGMPGYPVFTRKSHTDVSYLACARAMLAAPDAVYPQFATHNAFTIAAVHTLAADAEYEFQCLHGMGESIYDQVVGPARLDRRCRIYAPVGSHETLLAYLVRRLLENGANTSFVNRIVDPDVPIEALVEDPVAQAVRTAGAPHPRIPLPSQMLGVRRNSEGLDCADDRVLDELGRALAATRPYIEATPVLADAHAATRRSSDQRAIGGRAWSEVRNPADQADVVGAVAEATIDDVERAVSLAGDRGSAWSTTTVEERARCLERAADLFEAERAQLIALLVREAGRTVPNAVGEIREAVDFCRYYAMQARSELIGSEASARGPMVCISPWNFPLSIFVGQIAAALAAGNPVLAKPAEQTPLVASLAVALIHRAGVVPAALQLLTGRGEIVGAALIADSRIAGVLFTGSTAVARTINRQLARRDDDPVLIAEAGGQNAMIVDSSALIEQVIGDVLQSAFDSAGQRCSALRVLCVQEDVAEAVIAMLEGAMRELVLGDPRALATDIGPVIDADALQRLSAHVDRMRAMGLRVFQATPIANPPDAAGSTCGCYSVPTLIELGGSDGLSHLTEEIFGPVLHVVRWRRDELPALIDRINATGYGLTHGLHTRIDETVALVLDRIQAGNVYVNRNMIGAMVGVQPFGGLGLSGTGPKAGGPLYLRRLVRNLPPHLPSGMREVLPGPTGESNELQYRPRGTVACLADDERGLRLQARLAQSAGNAVVMVRSPLTLGTRKGLDAAPLQLVDAFDPTTVDAVLADLPSARLAQLRAQVATIEGKLVPVIVPDANGSYDLSRLVVERTVTINTAAAGGNAALLAIAADETDAEATAGDH